MLIARKIGPPWLLLSGLAISHYLIVNDYRKARASRHLKEIEGLFRFAIDLIKSRNDISIENIFSLRDMLDDTKFYIKRSQIKFISRLLNDLHVLRDSKEERKGSVSEKERQHLVAKERELLNRIEGMKPTIENYLSKIT